MTEQLQKKVNFAIKLIQAAAKMAKEHGQPLEVAYSGGKDSDVILELTKMASVEYRAIYHNTTIDPPGTIKHAKDMGAEVLKPKMTFLQIIEYAGFPTRFRRICCSILKEHKVYIAVDLPFPKDGKYHFERFSMPPNGTLYEMPFQDFIETDAFKALPKKTFCICNYVPSDHVQNLCRSLFENVFVYYPQ